MWCILGSKIESILCVLKTATLTIQVHSSSFSHLAMLHLHYYEVSLTRIAGCWNRSWLPWASLCKLTQLQRLWWGFFLKMHMRSRFSDHRRIHFFLLVLKNISDENTAIKIIFSFKKPENGMTANDKKQAFS